jgi:hypothetical protein
MIREGDRSSGFPMGWSDIFVETLKNNDVRFVTYAPYNVLTPLIKGVTPDNYFISVEGGTGRGVAIKHQAGC